MTADTRISRISKCQRGTCFSFGLISTKWSEHRQVRSSTFHLPPSPCHHYGLLVVGVAQRGTRRAASASASSYPPISIFFFPFPFFALQLHHRWPTRVCIFSSRSWLFALLRSLAGLAALSRRLAIASSDIDIHTYAFWSARLPFTTYLHPPHCHFLRSPQKDIFILWQFPNHPAVLALLLPSLASPALIDILLPFSIVPPSVQSDRNPNS